MFSELINNRINEDIKVEFVNLKENLKIHLPDNFNIKETKNFMLTYLPKVVFSTSEILLDTLINYLMEQAINDLNNADLKVQNEFYSKSFRNIYREWGKNQFNKLQNDLTKIDYSTDPQFKQGLIAAGITFVSGAILTSAIFIPEMLIGAIIGGIITIIISALAYKFAYAQAEPKSRTQLKDDIDSYLNDAERNVKVWLNSVTNAFISDFNYFCNDKGFTIGGINA